jgi:hypothetical protein
VKGGLFWEAGTTIESEALMLKVRAGVDVSDGEGEDHSRRVHYDLVQRAWVKDTIIPMAIRIVRDKLKRSGRY